MDAHVVAGISTHVLDTATGQPGAGIPVHLERYGPDGWGAVGENVTSADGRAAWSQTPSPGVHRLVFDTGTWAAARGGATFFPRVTLEFTVVVAEEHHHIPLLLAPYGYSTYRGS